MGVDFLEDSVEKGNMLHDQLIRTNVHAIKNIERMFDEEEYAGAKYLLSAHGEDER